MRLILNTPAEIANELRFARARLPLHSLVLVEGQTDRRHWERFKHKHSRFFSTQGKDKLLATIKIINSQAALSGVAGVIDPDFFLIEDAEELQMDNLLHFDLPDLELTMLNSDAYDTIMRNTLPLDMVPEYTDQLREVTLRLAGDYGYYRWLDHRNRHYNLAFNSVTFEDVIDAQSLELDAQRLAAMLAGGSDLTPNELLEQIDLLRQEQPCDVRLCRGRDALAIMALLIQRDDNLSGKVKVQSQSRELARMLRIAFDWTCLIATTLYNRIRNWERNNNPFRIIRNPALERTPT